jgi:hypothetical protein
MSGSLNHQKFQQSYSFLEKHQEEEIRSLENLLKTAKNTEKFAEIKETLIK